MSATPAGYSWIDLDNGGHAVAHDTVAGEVEMILAEQPLYEWAGSQANRRAMQGRAVAWAVALPGGTPVVVRHSRHGGLLAAITRDLFLRPRAHHELTTALWLESAGVPTPQLLAYAVYSAGPVLRRSDVASREIGNARDLADYCMKGGEPLDAALELTAALLNRMAAAGAHHPDLNAKNVLISSDPNPDVAWLLDVDRVSRRPGGEAMSANVHRLTHSMRKWVQRYGARVSAGQIERIARLAEQ